MGYKIAYKGGKSVKFNTKSSRILPKKAITFSCLIILTAVLIYAGAGKYLRNFFMPGLSDAALSSLAEDLKSGVSLKDAVSAFCSGVIEDAGITD